MSQNLCVGYNSICNALDLGHWSPKGIFVVERLFDVNTAEGTSF